MKKLGSLVAAFVLSLSVFSFSGCTQSEISVISNQAGMFSVLTWMSFDNPSPEVKSYVSSIIQLIQNSSADIQVGKTLTESLYMIVATSVDSSDKIPVNVKPLVKAGGLAALNGLDLLMVSHPEYFKTKDDIIAAINSFAAGANNALTLSESDPRVKSAVNSSLLRSSLKLNN